MLLFYLEYFSIRKIIKFGIKTKYSLYNYIVLNML